MTQDFSSIEQVITDGQILSAELSKVKTYTDKRMVEEYQQRIARYRISIKKADKWLADTVRQCQDWRGTLKILDETLRADNDEAKSEFWAIHNGEKVVSKGGDVYDSEPVL